MLTWPLTSWSLTFGPIFSKKKQQKLQKVIVFLVQNWDQIGQGFFDNWIARWINFFRKSICSFRFETSSWGKLGPKWDQKCRLWERPASGRKNLKISKRVIYFVDTYQDYLWSKCQLNRTFFTGVIVPKPPKLGSIGTRTQKNEVYLLDKVDNDKYPEVKSCGSTKHRKVRML